MHAWQEPVLRSGRLSRIEPADHSNGGVGDHAALHLAGRLLGADVDDPKRAARSATSSRISLIGDAPSLGAYLLSSSRTRNSSGLASPEASLSSKVRRMVVPTTKRLARSGSQLCRFPARDVSVHHNDVVELEVAAGSKADPVGEGSRIFSAEDATHYVVAVSSAVAFSIVL
jgi:hypothetical protein